MRQIGSVHAGLLAVACPARDRERHHGIWRDTGMDRRVTTQNSQGEMASDCLRGSQPNPRLVYVLGRAQKKLENFGRWLSEGEDKAHAFDIVLSTTTCSFRC